MSWKLLSMRLFYNFINNMLSIPKQHMLWLIANYLETVDQHKLASKIHKKCSSSESSSCPLLSKKLHSIVRNYVSQHQTLLDFYLNQQQVEEEQPIPQPTAKKVKLFSHVVFKKKETQGEEPRQPLELKGTKLMGFSQPKLLETTVIDRLEVVEFDQTNKRKRKRVEDVEPEEEEMEVDDQEDKQEEQAQPEPQPPKKQKKKARKASHISSQAQPQPKKKNQKPPRQPRQPLKCSTMSKQQLLALHPQVNAPKVQTGQKRFFTRIDHKLAGDLPDHLRDNTFQAKFKFGAGDEWGKYGHEKLKDTRGDSFKKTKGKLKNKAFQAAGIDIHKVNSIKLA